ncbi:D-alanine--D-alanine ligase [Gluconobacter thailandicus F149-1 = NBRC 100600]|uniref:D-alanine--D-alanine ligase n=1 Tax=Gluconobacter thailandicus NBRC 3257 TaxID=1381097 RepID=A0ABQ0ISR7_GLUTH|nr:D-alanine--D-alanine ligase [Gluconobacter thailandicus]KXV53367.1 D-alanine--D-alanine ligase [Gluconobacter thailandicus]GAC88353.1 D-alanine--D-alanine ligase [Gluconobacter thailandicus NBRC 3255]GAD25200.1 D-alanine--D-alanine ligase [Gluconobacter thailandicus NBRC 3257]GAN94459.1 D-alanine--D-alanine ligase [Gluconobacter thailandicus F149-1 = NBRC 100600]GBR59002.1 D-alanine--D-alanine ligase [Gluconobacter thailandicus F149-1 = NBRC 100600]
MKVAVLYGGTSSERPVSLVSGEAAISALREKGHDVTPVDIGPDIATTIQALKTASPDVVFNALHGPKGEDGAIQGVLEWLNLPYTHSGIRASAVAMDKGATRILLAAAGLPVAEGRVVTATELAEADPLPVPYVIKPVAEGSSVGVEIIRAGDNRRAEIARTWRFGKEALVESFIPGRELTAGVMGNRALAVTDILPAETAAFYDFEAKYKAGGSRHVVPADLPESVTARALDYALRAHQTLGCAGASRTDFRYDDETDTLIILEVNTQPGMTPTSLLPEQAAYCGISYPDLCDWMVREALNR